MRAHARILRGALGATVVMALVILGTACSSSGSKSSDTTTTSTTLGSKTVSLSVGGRAFTLSLDHQLPAGWPSDFPIPSDTDAAGSGSYSGQAQNTMVGVFTTTKTPQDAFSFYQSGSDLQTSNAVSVGAGKRFVGMLDFTGKFTGSVYVVSNNGTTYIIPVLRSQNNSTTTS